ESILASGQEEMVSMARPFLADAEFVAKAKAGQPDDINTCIACNQACLDHVFKGKRASCLVNPKACYETELIATPVRQVKQVAVIGGGMAGISCATEAAERGHDVTLFEKSDRLGGQFNLAMAIPGKEEFKETIRYYLRRLEKAGVTVKLNQTVDVDTLSAFDDVVVATGVKPRRPAIEGIEHPKVIDYQTFIRDNPALGSHVAIIGAGGIGVDVATMITEPKDQSLDDWLKEWGIDKTISHEGGLYPGHDTHSDKQVWVLQRREGRVGKGPGKTTGWIHRKTLQKRGVNLVGGVTYHKIDDEGLHVSIKDEAHLIPATQIILCAGQESVNQLAEQLKQANLSYHLIGGAEHAGELDAKRAIRQGIETALAL
ncbi:FAD-dependent oxidoreductase, partial [Salinivibrio kushneri]|uniref:FAD-dependent oxidoreductase n=1 Tax=Salinivibrio kushneri TaxID=1908198 RepID=UPI0009CFA6DB